MTDKQPEALIRAEELEQIGAESSLARAMAAHTIRLLYKENEALRTRLAQPEQREVEIEFKEWIHPHMGLVPVDPKTPLILKAVIREKNT